MNRYAYTCTAVDCLSANWTLLSV